MSKWNDPRVVVTFLLILMFGYAFLRDPSDEAMKGAVIIAFATAYGFWLGNVEGSKKASENTGKAFAAIEATAAAATVARSAPIEQMHVEAEKVEVDGDVSSR